MALSSLAKDELSVVRILGRTFSFHGLVLRYILAATFPSCETHACFDAYLA